MQPAELLIIAGAAIGTLLVANPMHILKGIVAGMLGVLKGKSQFSKARYLNALKMMYQFLNKVRKEGLLSVEDGRGEAAGERDLQELSRVSGRSSCAAILCATRCAWRSPAAWSRSTWTR